MPFSVYTEDGVFLMAQSKIKTLEETLRLHRLNNSCQEFESWMDDKENILNTFSSDSGDLDVVQAKYEVKGISGQPFSASVPLTRATQPINHVLKSGRTS